MLRSMLPTLFLCAVFASPVAAAEPLPPGCVARYGSDRFRLPGGVTYKFQVSPNGRYALLHDFGRLRVYDTNTGVAIATHEGYLLEAVVRDDGGVLVVRMTDTGMEYASYHRDGRLRKTTPFLIDGEVLLSPDGVTALVMEASKKASWVDTATGRILNRLPLVLNKRESGATFSADGRWLAVGDPASNTIAHVYDARTAGRAFRVVVPDAIEEMHFNPNGQRLLVKIADAAVVFEVPTGRKQRTIPARAFNFASNDTVMAEYRPDGEVQFIDLLTNKTRRMKFDADLDAIRPLADGRLITANNGAITIRDTLAGRRLPQSAELMASIDQLRLTADGRVIAHADGWVTWNADGKLSRFQTNGGARPRNAAGPQPPALSADRRHYAEVSDKGVSVGLTATGRQLHFLPREGDDEERIVPTLWFGPASATLFHVAADAKLRATDFATGQTRRVTLDGVPTDADDFVPSPDGRLVAVLNTDANVLRCSALFLNEAATGKSRLQLPLAGDNPRAVFSPDGQYLAAVSNNLGDRPDHCIVIDTATGRICRTMAFTDSNDNIFALSPDGRTLAYRSADDDGNESIDIRETVSGAARRTIPLPKDRTPTALAFAPDGRTLASATDDGFVWIWDLTWCDPDPRLPPDDWTALASADARVAHRAMRGLIAKPTVAVAFFNEKLKPAAAADELVVEAALAALASPKFAQREAASRQLAAVADRALPQLRAALKTPNAEVRQRLEVILDDARRISPANLRVVRAVEVLENLARTTPAAEVLLRAWAAGLDGPLLTSEANAARTRQARPRVRPE